MNSDEIAFYQNQRNYFRKLAHETGESSAWAFYRSVRNKLKQAIRRARTVFTRNALSSKKPKEVWQVIHRILKPSANPIRENPNSLNEHFLSTSARALSSEFSRLPEMTVKFGSTFEKSSDDDNIKFTLTEVCYNDILREIKTLRSDTSTGTDGIPTKFIKYVAEDLAGPLCHIINNCIKLSYFPAAWKLSRISPIPKCNDPASMDDWRPISILPVMSKIFERLVSRQLITYLDSAALLKDNISGFRRGHSTETTLLKIRDDIICAMARGEVTLLVMLDYSKAFDTVNHDKLIEKMQKFGFSPAFIKWCYNYLSNRRQFVQIDDMKSEVGYTEFGVPQGSVLGPLFFNIYVNDLADSLPSNMNSMQYADDTSLYSHSKPGDLVSNAETINNTLSDLHVWSASSHLVTNCKKTKTMIISTPQMAHRHNLHELNMGIYLDGTLLEQVPTARLLGMHLDSHLKWRDHVTMTIKSCISTLSVLRKIKNFADFKLRKQLAETLILSKLDYNMSVFHPLPAYLMKRLQRTQNAAASFVLNKYVKDVNDIIRLGWLPVEQRRDYHILKLTFKATHFEQWPAYLKLNFAIQREGLRSSSARRLHIPLIKGTFQDCAARTFNSLPPELRNCDDFRTFSNSCFKFLMGNVVVQS